MLCFHLMFMTQVYTTKSMVLEATLCQSNIPLKLNLGLHCHRLGDGNMAAMVEMAVSALHGY